MTWIYEPSGANTFEQGRSRNTIWSSAPSPHFWGMGGKSRSCSFFSSMQNKTLWWNVGVDYIRSSAGHFFLIDKAISGGVMNSVCGSFYIPESWACAHSNAGSVHAPNLSVVQTVSLEDRQTTTSTCRKAGNKAWDHNSDIRPPSGHYSLHLKALI